jgi:hypothetical protein
MTEIYTEIAVIGGGPAGMIAAGKAAKSGQKTILLEKQPNLGEKLLLTGHGRCNLTATIYEVDSFIKDLRNNGEFLYSSLYQFDVRQTLKFFKDRGVEVKEERGKRIFPKSDQAQTILDCLKDYLGENKVEFHLNAQVQNVAKDKENDKFIIYTGDSEITTDKLIIATGGLSYPVTGSSGDGYKWAEKLGHTINELRPALVPLTVKEEWIGYLQGLSLKNVNISVYQNDKKQEERFGEAIFTDKGMSGPIIIDMSAKIGQLLKNGEVELRIDFKPALSYPKLDKRLLREFDKNGKKMFKNILTELLPQKAIPTFIQLSEIPAGKACHQITGEERNRLLHLLKNFTLHVEDLLGIKYAIVTAGGVELKDIDPQTMESKLLENLYFAGEILDVHGPTGGYNLQICWTTGYVAGQNAASKRTSRREKTKQKIALMTKH